MEILKKGFVFVRVVSINILTLSLPNVPLNSDPCTITIREHDCNLHCVNVETNYSSSFYLLYFK